jgi:hypothetical protein
MTPVSTLTLILATTLGAIIVAGAPDRAFAGAPALPDAELFATNNTAVITDPADPRLDARLVRFDASVKAIIRNGGGAPRASRLLDGVFFSSELGTTTFERSRDFDLDGVTRRELHTIADRIRRRFHQQSVLTFDYAERPRDPRDAVEIEVPGISAKRFRDGLVADAEARRRLVGGSRTLSGRLVLIAARTDLPLAKRFATGIGGDVKAATVRFGHREFVG